MPAASVPSIPSAPSHWDQRAACARVLQQARQRQIHALLSAAGWRAGTSIGPAVGRMALPDRETLIRLLEADAPGARRKAGRPAGQEIPQHPRREAAPRPAPLPGTVHREQRPARQTPYGSVGLPAWGANAATRHTPL